tara:strand:+ start:48 stop:182 length:135 start_codon:yes stop_codon:yes gene_type:complete
VVVEVVLLLEMVGVITAMVVEVVEPEAIELLLKIHHLVQELQLQ